MTIYIDADSISADKIKKTVSIAKTYKIEVTCVHDYNHIFYDDEIVDYCKDITVDCHKNEADMKIFNTAKKGDIIITKDYGLATMCLAKHCLCLNPSGYTYTDKNMEYFNNRRHINSLDQGKRNHTKTNNFGGIGIETRAFGSVLNEVCKEAITIKKEKKEYDYVG